MSAAQAIRWPCRACMHIAQCLSPPRVPPPEHIEDPPVRLALNQYGGVRGAYGVARPREAALSPLGVGPCTASRREARPVKLCFGGLFTVFSEVEEPMSLESLCKDRPSLLGGGDIPPLRGGDRRPRSRRVAPTTMMTTSPKCGTHRRCFMSNACECPSGGVCSGVPRHPLECEPLFDASHP